MSTIQKIAKNTAVLVIANLISMVIGFLINIYMARYLSEDSFGMIFAAINLATLFTLFTDLGVSTFLTIQLSRNNELLKPYLNNALAIKLGLAVLAFLGIISVAFLTPYTGTKLIVVFIIGLYIVITAISQIFQSIFQAAQSMEHIAITQLLNPVILLAGTIYVIASGMDVVAFALVYLTSGIVILAYNLTVVVLFYHRPLPAFDTKLWKMLILGGLPLSLSAIFSFIYFRIDVQLIDFILGDVAVGNYGAAFKVIDAVVCIPAMYTMAILPVISYYFHKNSPDLQVLLEKSLKYLLILGIPISIGGVLCADKIIYLMYLDKYADSVPVLQGLSLGMLIMFINYMGTTVLTATNLQKTFMVINAFSAVINIFLNLMVIPVYGIAGSAYTMVLTQGIICVLTFYTLHKKGYRLPDMASVAKITVCGAIMGLYVFAVRDWNIFLIIATAAILYFALILISRAFWKDDIALLAGIRSKKGNETKESASEAGQ